MKRKQVQDNKFFIVLLTALVFLALGLVIGVFFLKPMQNVELKESQKNAVSLEIISGNVFYLERIVLPSGSKVKIELQDVSLMDAPAKIIAIDEIITTGENVPIPFTLSFDKNQIIDNHTYSIRATISLNDKLTWISTENNLVLTNGDLTNNIEIRVEKI